MGKKNKNRITSLPSQQPGHKNEVRQAMLHAEHFSGPLPQPAILRQYDEVIPGAAERIIAMAETQAKHRQQLENKVIDSGIRDSRLGLHYGLIIGLCAVAGGTACIILGHQIGGSIIGGVGLSGLVGVFVYGSAQHRKERESRMRAEVSARQQR